MSHITVNIKLNGHDRALVCESWDSLRTVLRQAGCFSVKFGSEHGDTGAAAVLLDGRLVSSDVLLAAQADGHEVTTVESMNQAELHPIQSAFLVTGAMQSGYSVGAMILGTVALLRKNASPSEADIRDMLGGILDRETAYVKPVEAVKRAAALMRGHAVEPFRPEIVTPMTNGTDAVDVDPNDTPITVSPAVPRLIPSRDVPETRVVGKPEIKVDGLKLVKGNPAFVDDIELRGMLYAKVLRSPHAHARILDIDDSKARALPGVVDVIHYKNIPRVQHATGGQSWPNPYPWDQVTFDNKVRHVGDRVAAVAAETEQIAEEALKLIEVTYEVLPFILDERDAMRPGAPVIHDETDSPGIHDASRNLVHHIKGFTPGDIDRAFAESDHVFEDTYRVHQVQQCPIEPHITIAWLDEDERLVVRTATQVPFHVRRMLAPVVGLPISRVRVIKPRIGGGFGAKQEMAIEDIPAHLALRTRRPVRLELTRREEFESSRTRHPQTITFKTGVMNDGSLMAQQMSMIGNTGAYGTHGFTVQNVAGLRGLSSYNAKFKKFDCHVVYTNIPVPGAYRGYGAPQAEFALESHMEDIARQLGRDPMDFKRQNWVKAGDRLDIVTRLGERGESLDLPWEQLPMVMTSGIEECVAQGKRAIGWHRKDDLAWVSPADRPNIRRGLGFAFCMHGSAIPFVDMGGCSIKINDDGSFNLAAGAADLGTGADTVMAQIAAEVLGVTIDDIIVYSGDTDHTPFDVGAYASSTTYISGMAVKKASDELRWKIKKRAALLLGIADEDVCTIELRDKRCVAADGRSVSLEEVALDSLHTQDQSQMSGSGSHWSADCPAPFAAQFVEIEIDVQTGQVTVIKMVMAVDCGVAINPITASGQVEGGMAQALGYAHCEEYAYDENGAMINNRFGPYRIYRADEMPEVEVYLVQTMEDSGPFGAKAVAEIPKDGMAPAIRAAIHNATGVAINDLPFTPERVWNALRKHHAWPAPRLS
jgi:putative selenate reductase molybdopterin-binding subunit